MPRSPWQRLLGVLGSLVVLLLLVFIVLPAVVVTIAAFNSKAILSFPPQNLTLHWFSNALAYPDFRAGFHNGLVVAPWSATIALVVGVTFFLTFVFLAAL